MSANGTGHSEQSRVGFTKAAEYDKYRPSYPKESVDALLNALHLSSAQGATIVDLAAGTGKFTELLCHHQGGYNIVAVEPNEHMRSELVKKNLAGVQVEDGLANSIPLADGKADAVVIAQVSKKRKASEVEPKLREKRSFGTVFSTYRHRIEYVTFDEHVCMEMGFRPKRALRASRTTSYDPLSSNVGQLVTLIIHSHSIASLIHH